MPWIKINDHYLVLSDISTVAFAPNEATITTRHGRRFRFTDESAEALRLWAGTLPGVVDLADMLRRARAAASAPAKDPIPSQVYAQKRHEQTHIPVPGAYKPAECPMREWHAELTVACAACGIAPYSAPKPARITPPPPPAKKKVYNYTSSDCPMKDWQHELHLICDFCGQYPGTEARASQAASPAPPPPQTSSRG
jgi:hypothetical protein